MQHVGCGLLNVEDVDDRRITKSWKLIERDKQLGIAVQHPDSMPGDMCDLNSRTIVVMNDGFHLILLV